MLSFQNAIRRFGADKRGATGMTFAMMAIPVTLVIGGAVDYATALNARSRLQLATDTPERKFRPEGVATFASGARAGGPWPLAERMRPKSHIFRSAV